MRRICVILGAFLLLSACSEDAQQSFETLEEQPGVVSVDAPVGKCWTGSIGNSTKEACGSKDFDISGESIIVANAQKQDPGRWKLTLSLEVDGEEVDSGSTSANFGIVQVSE